MMCPRTPNAKVSVAVKPAGSPVWRPESLSTSFKPARAFLLAEGARPNLPAKRRSVVDATMICSEHETTISSCAEKEGYVRVDTPPLEDIYIQKQGACMHQCPQTKQERWRILEELTMFVGDPMKSQRAPKAPFPLTDRGSIACIMHREQNCLEKCVLISTEKQETTEENTRDFRRRRRERPYHALDLAEASASLKTLKLLRQGSSCCGHIEGKRGWSGHCCN